MLRRLPIDWGLRDYGIPPSIWGGDPECEHEWGQETIRKMSGGDAGGSTLGTASGGNAISPEGIQRSIDRSKYEASQGAHCRCGAWRGCLGLEPTPEMYVAHLVEVCRGLWRVLRDDGTFWLNLGDSYAASRSYQVADTKHTDVGNVRGSTVPEGLKAKDLVMMPHRVALALQAEGWWVRSTIIFAKKNPMPESCTDRPTSSYEEIFELTKSGKPTYWTHRDGPGVRKKPKADYRYLDLLEGNEYIKRPEEFNTIDKVPCPDCNGKGELSGWFGVIRCEDCKGKGKVKRWKRINLWRGHDYFYDQEAVREPQTGGTHTRGKGPNGSRTLEELTPKNSEVRDDRGIADFLHYSAMDVPAGRNLRNVWTITTQPYSQAHFATFPEKIPEICIKAGTSEKGCCPICGAPWNRVVERVASLTTIEPHGPKDKERGEQGLRTSARMGGGAGWRKRGRDAVDEWKKSCGADKNGEYHGVATKDYGGTGAENPSEVKARILRGMMPKVTTGFQPTCECDSMKPVPCVVLDPFAGTFTTGKMARDLGRSAIGIDISVDYCIKYNVKKPQENRPDCLEGPCEKCGHFRESYKKLAMERAMLHTPNIMGYKPSPDKKGGEI